MDRLARAAQEACRAPLLDALGAEVGEAVYLDFVQGYDDLRGQLRASPGYTHAPYASRRAAIANWQRGVLDAGHELKIWSRQSLLAVALERNAVPVTADLVHGIVDDGYWQYARDHSQLREDAVSVLGALERAAIPFHLATNSDGFLVFDSAEMTFRYDPEHAAAEKRRRLRCLERVGIRPADVTVGDPIGKPDPRFFDGVVADFSARLGRPLELDQTLVIGDSLTNDIMPLVDRGAKHGAWVVAKHPAVPQWLAGPTEGHRRVLRIQRLTALTAYDWSASAP